MNIHIGERLGKVYDFFTFVPKYAKFVVLNDVRYKNWKQCSEICREPDMYLVDGFIPKPGEVVYDIGAQYGDWAILWAKKYHAFVYAFEPLELNWGLALNNVYRNRMEDRVKVFDSIIGDGHCFVFEERGNMLARNPFYDYSKIIHLSEHDMVCKRSERLDDIFNQGYLNGNPDILKIDVEGSEHDVLVGASLLIMRFHPKIIIETHSSILREQCTETLQSLGYTLKHVGRTVKGKGWMDEVSVLFFDVVGDVR